MKKALVDNACLDIPQHTFESLLIEIIQLNGFGQTYVDRYKMMTRFYHKRLPIVIFFSGTKCIGKSTLATKVCPLIWGGGSQYIYMGG